MQTTFPRLMLEHARQRPDAPALREKEYGIWQAVSWASVAALVRQLACGLAARGVGLYQLRADIFGSFSQNGVRRRRFQ